MRRCECGESHRTKRIVLTGGPGGGKTAILELIRLHFCQHVRVLPEAASIIFGGGFPRGATAGLCQAAQRAIYYVQRELETVAAVDGPAVVICDRGTLDGAAYWVGPGDLWTSVGTTREEELRRYDAVIHLRTPNLQNGYNHTNPLRIESAQDAKVIDDQIEKIWEGHPRRFIVEASENFLEKAHRALDILRAEMPKCCRNHTVQRNGGP